MENDQFCNLFSVEFFFQSSSSNVQKIDSFLSKQLILPPLKTAATKPYSNWMEKID